MRAPTVQFKRHRKNITNYKTRLKLLLSLKPRLVVRPSLKGIVVQLTQYNSKGDDVKVTVNGQSLRKLGWPYNTGNLPAAYICGLLAGAKAKKAGISEAILDMGGVYSVKGSRVYAVVKGCKEAGLQVPCGEEVLPSEERVVGKHIEGYGSSDSGKSKYQFSTYKTNVSKMSETVKSMKDKITEMTNG